MVLRPQMRLALVLRAVLLASLMVTGAACVTTDEGIALPVVTKNPDAPIRLPDAEHMIDDLDRIMTAYGTISVKTPDVWGQDRLAKFRSEYETQMSAWLKQGFKSDVNAAVRRTELDSTRVSLAANTVGPPTRNSTSASASPSPAPAPVDLEAMLKSQAALNPGPVVATSPPDKSSVALEPTIVLDEHSNYLNHLNQLRRTNSGDDLTDRPGYGLYLIRIPVTLSPGPRSRRGKGAIITVSARSVTTKQTLRGALRNAVINETVTNLTQAIISRSGENADQDPGWGAGTFSLLSFADTELYHGAENIGFLKSEAERQVAEELNDEPHHRSSRIAEWLRGELQTSYHLLEEAATPAKTGQLAAFDPLEELGDLILKRDFLRIAQVQPGRNRDSRVLQTAGGKSERGDDLIEQRRRVVNILAFAMRIQAAGLNRRLKQDMTDQDPELTPAMLKPLSFFAAEPSDEALRVFQQYVDKKWPLRVYAIEPVIAQQNVADAFGRRRFSAIDLVGSATGGPLRALSGVEAQRQAADDETAIRLNPTMVGFGAGSNTFGWVFYPRLQTGGAGRSRLFTDLALLASGRVPDPIGGDQSIEPGQRECTALVEMPNFVPKIEFITVANWFRTSEVGEGQKSDLEKAAVLGRKLELAVAAINRAKVEGHYRSEELQIAIERLNQLRSLMPTQRMVVRVPFADNQNDARIFCSHGFQLRPTILGWHGRPPEEGEESTLFLEGKNFSIHDTHVIAGGKVAPAVLVSRQLLEVTIPKDACPTPSSQGTALLDINVATPNGVSNHLLIKMRASTRHAEKREEKIEKSAEHELRRDEKAVAAALAVGHEKKEDKKPPQPALDMSVLPRLLVPLH